MTAIIEAGSFEALLPPYRDPVGEDELAAWSERCRKAGVVSTSSSAGQGAATFTVTFASGHTLTARCALDGSVTWRSNRRTQVVDDFGTQLVIEAES